MSGKGTMSVLIAKSFKLDHIDLGSIIRKSDRAEVKRIIDAGGLLDDSMVIDLAADRIACLDNIVLDGFPRSVNQAKFLCGLEDVNFVGIELQLSLDVALERMNSRLLCASCSKPVNGADEKCACGASEWVKRADDNTEVLSRRYKEYENYAQPVLEVCKERMPITSLNGAVPLTVLRTSIMNTIAMHYGLSVPA
jgi:adenylate kinase